MDTLRTLACVALAVTHAPLNAEIADGASLLSACYAAEADKAPLLACYSKFSRNYQNVILYDQAQKGNIGLVNDLLTLGANPVFSLHGAAENGHEKIVQLSLESGAQPNSLHPWASINDWRDQEETPLTHAARNGHTNIVKLLINAGANATSRKALFAAASKGYAEIVKMILDANTSDLNDALIVAAGSGQLEIVKILLSAHADPKYTTEIWHENARHAAEQEGYRDIVEVLKAAEAQK